MADDGIPLQETEGKSLPTSSIDRNRRLDEVQEQEPAEREIPTRDKRKFSIREDDIASKIWKSAWSKRFYEAVQEGNLHMVTMGLDYDSMLLRTRFTKFEANAIQVAVAAGQEKVFLKLMEEVHDNDILKHRNDYGETTLTIAAANGNKEIVKQLVGKCDELADIPGGSGELPITVAALFGKEEIVTYLFDFTLAIYSLDPSCWDVKEGVDKTNSTQTSSVDDDNFKVLKVSMTTQVYGHDEGNYSFKLDNEDKDQAKPAYQSRHHSFRLFKACINSQFYDIAFEVFNLFPMVCINEMAEEDGETMNSLAMASIEELKPRNFVTRFHEKCVWSLERWGSSRMPLSQFAKSWYENNYTQPKSARLLLRRICRHIWISEKPDEIMQRVLTRPILTAVKDDNRGFIAAVTDLCPDAFWLKFDKLSPIPEALTSAPPHLSKDLLEVCISAMKNPKIGLLRTIQADRNGNTILHHAAALSSAKTLSRFVGPSLKMQREIQWFKKAEKLAPMFKGVENRDNHTPMDLFAQEHRKLKKAGEKWLKETASSCSLLATLIITVMFSAAYTAPGGYDNDTGSPVHLGSKYFTVFIISDALSLFFSCTSAMVFLGIYTSLFREEDFLKRLPITLISGLFTLFLSIITMVIAFSAALILTLSEHFVWIALPVLMLASIPAIIYSVLHIQIFVTVLYSTLFSQ